MRKERFMAEVGPLIAKKHHVIKRSAEALAGEASRSSRRRWCPRGQKTSPCFMKRRQGGASGLTVEISRNYRSRYGVSAFASREVCKKRPDLGFTQGIPLAKVGKVHIHQTQQTHRRLKGQDLGASISILLAIGKGKDLQSPSAGEGRHDHQPRSRGEELTRRLKLPEFRASRRHVSAMGGKRRFKMPNRTPPLALGVEHFLKTANRPRPIEKRLPKMMHAVPVSPVAFPSIQGQHTDCHAYPLKNHAKFWRETLAVSDDSIATKKEYLRES